MCKHFLFYFYKIYIKFETYNINIFLIEKNKIYFIIFYIFEIFKKYL